MPEKVLVADDEPEILRFVEMTLEHEGFEVVGARDGEEALRGVLDHHPDLVILDVMMPRIDGFEVCRRLRNDPRTSNVSVIMLTARSLSADRLLGLTSGADDYIIKPFDPVELVARVKSTLRRAREMRDVNPLTGFPGNLAILQELRRRIEGGLPLALMHVDLDNFKAYNDHYGFLRGDEAIRATGRILQESAAAAGEGSFIGHIGGDDFAVVCAAAAAEVLAKEIIVRFERFVTTLYDEEDARQGSVSLVNRRGEVIPYPLMTVSIGIATNVQRRIESHWEASKIAAEMKTVAKGEPKSSFAIDRRRE